MLINGSCRNVHQDPEARTRGTRIAVAVEEKQENLLPIASFTDEVFARIKATLASPGSRSALPPNEEQGLSESQRSRVRVVAANDAGEQQQVEATICDYYCLSSGSTLYFLEVAGCPAEYDWIVGQGVEIAVDEVVASCQSL